MRGVARVATQPGGERDLAGGRCRNTSPAMVSRTDVLPAPLAPEMRSNTWSSSRRRQPIYAAIRVHPVVSAMWRRCLMPTSIPAWSNVRLRQAPSARCGWTSRGPTTRRQPDRSSATCWWSAAGYTGLWTALHAAQRNPDRRIVLIEANRIGWAASGRNGGFVDASLTHGLENGKTRWPNEIDTLEAMGRENLDGMQADIESLGLDAEWQRTGMLSVATEPHQVDWLRRRRRTMARGSCSACAKSATRFIRRPIWRACTAPTPVRSSIPPSSRSNWPAPARKPVCASTSTPTHSDLDSAGVALRIHGRRRRPSPAATRCWRRTSFPSLLRRNRLRTVPVYDYVLATEPLTDAQLDRIGWRRRQGIGDCANQFHYYRLTVDNRIVWGGYDAVYHFGRKVDDRYEDRAATYRRLAAHFFITFPATRRRPVHAIGGRARSTPTPGSARTGDWPATAGWPTSTGSPGSASPRRGSPPTCASTCSTASRRRAPNWRWCAGGRCRFRRSRWPASESRRRDGRWIAPTTRRDGATSCCARSMRWGSASIPEFVLPSTADRPSSVSSAGMMRKGVSRHERQTDERREARTRAIADVEQRGVHADVAG